MIKNKYTDTEKIKLEAIKEMTERGYDKDVINEWISHIE
jgi:hypothetical protein